MNTEALDLANRTWKRLSGLSVIMDEHLEIFLVLESGSPRNSPVSGTIQTLALEFLKKRLRELKQALQEYRNLAEHDIRDDRFYSLLDKIQKLTGPIAQRGLICDYSPPSC